MKKTSKNESFFWPANENSLFLNRKYLKDRFVYSVMITGRNEKNFYFFNFFCRQNVKKNLKFLIFYNFLVQPRYLTAHASVEVQKYKFSEF